MMIKTYYYITEDDFFIGVDLSSGGYPFKTDLISCAKLWENKDQALIYMYRFPNKNWKLNKLVIP